MLSSNFSEVFTTDTTQFTHKAGLYMSIDQFHKSHDAPVPYSTMLHSEQKCTNFTNLKMHLFDIPQCSIENWNVHISVLNGALWDIGQVHSGICELGRLWVQWFSLTLFSVLCCTWGSVCYKQVYRTCIRNYMLQYMWDVITYPCPRYLLLAHESQYTLDHQS